MPGLACSPGWDEYNGMCYFGSTDNKNAADAEIACKAYNAHLVTISDVAEQVFVKSIL